MTSPRLAVLIISLATIACPVSRQQHPPRQPSLEELWSRYKAGYLQTDGYILDRSRHGGEVTSEGQGYALLRAVWMGDEKTFRRVFEWTESRLRRPDGLYSWRWSPAAGGRVLDENSATDADQEIAWALILAAARWDQPAYRERAGALLVAIREGEGLALEGGWFPAAGNWAVTERIVNLSYFLPYAYPYFARVDSGGDWEGVIDRGYRILKEALDQPGARLVPDFMLLNHDGSAGALPTGSTLSGEFAHDAMRIYWRAAFDCRLHRRTEACSDPANTTELLDLLVRDGRLGSRYATDGRLLDRRECLCFYAMAHPAIALQAPDVAEQIQKNQLDPARLWRAMEHKDRYYDLNWVWFGQALSEGFLLEATPPLESLTTR